ncbi:phosphate ABC transporter permease PstA [Halovenus amylolytica]|uniref:phosphate ABC transporter permease PstA n=1 Tax=Halovenus amylolytica TaxID=2500550 RepID=UPI0036066875
MASEPTDGGTASDRPTLTMSISQLRGRIFELISAGATIFGITVVMGMLVYVARDALRLGAADPGWYLVFFWTLVVPSLGMAGYFAVRDRAAGSVAYAATGIPVIGILVAGGLVIVFTELIDPQEWLALVFALVVAGAIISAHQRYRPQATFERLLVLFLTPILTLYGIPALSVDRAITTPLTGTELFTLSFSTPALLPSVRELLFVLPILPAGWILLLGTVTAPLAYGFGRLIAARRDDERGRLELVAVAVTVVAIAANIGPLVGLSAEGTILVTTALLVPTLTYLEGVVRRREGFAGLAFPVVLVGGTFVGAVLATSLGFASPDPWLDWSFLTSAPSRTPEDAGMYPPLVGSILIVIVIAMSAFPVGVGAAIYLEEYAPDSGRLGRFVDFLEVNIGNLAGVPSIVYGLLGLALFVNGVGLRDGIVIVAGLTIGLLILPIVIISSQEAIKAVPDSRREASYGMGATRWQTIRHVVLPEAFPGILTGTILAMGRAIGETAPLLMIGVADSVRSVPDGFFDIAAAMPAQIFSWKSELAPEFRTGVMAAGVITLLVVLLVMNGTAIVLRNKYQRE